jgi:hypothetical protein
MTTSAPDFFSENLSRNKESGKTNRRTKKRKKGGVSLTNLTCRQATLYRLIPSEETLGETDYLKMKERTWWNAVLMVTNAGMGTDAYGKSRDNHPGGPSSAIRAP